MKKGFFASVTAALAGAGVALADGLPAAAPATPPLAVAPSAPDVHLAPATCCGEDPPAANQLWATAEYLLWWVKKGPVPVPLITTGPITDPFPGSLGSPNTSVVFGNTAFDYQSFSGGRVSAGYWFDPEQTVGIEASGFLLERRPASFSAGSDTAGNTTLVMPVNDMAPGAIPRFTISESDLRYGNVDVTSASRLWGAEANGVFSVVKGGELHASALVGFRYLDLQESLNVSSQSTALPLGDVIFLGATVFPPASVAVVDSFNTRNQFYGGQIGGKAEYTYGQFFGAVSAKFGFGDNKETINTFGVSTLFVPPGTPAMVASGGRLVGLSNGGHFTHDDFSFVPEVEVKVGARITDYFKAFVGYNFLYWTNVVRPGNQINQTEDTRQFPTSVIYDPTAVPLGPVVQFKTSGYWAQGVSFGFEFDY